jgi:hypothetical protein
MPSVRSPHLQFCTALHTVQTQLRQAQHSSFAQHFTPEILQAGPGATAVQIQDGDSLLQAGDSFLQAGDSLQAARVWPPQPVNTSTAPALPDAPMAHGSGRQVPFSLLLHSGRQYPSPFFFI